MLVEKSSTLYEKKLLKSFCGLKNCLTFVLALGKQRALLVKAR